MKPSDFLKMLAAAVLLVFSIGVAVSLDSQPVEIVPLTAQVRLLRAQHDLDEALKHKKDVYGSLMYYQFNCETFRDIVKANQEIPRADGVVNDKQTAFDNLKKDVLKENNKDEKKFVINVDTMRFDPAPEPPKEEKK